MSMQSDRDSAWPLRPVALCLLIAVLLGAALRLYHLAECSIWYDEGASLYLRHLVDAHGTILDPHENNEAPMNAVLTRIWYDGIVRSLTHYPVTSAQNDFLIRLMPCLLSIFSIPLVFVVARRVLQDPWAGVIAALLFAVSPYQIKYAQELRIYAFYTFIGLLALYCLLRALDENRTWAWIGLVALLSLAVYSHFFAVWTIFSFNAYYLCVIWPYRRHFWRWVAANVAILVLIAYALKLAFFMNEVVKSLVYTWYPNPTWKSVFITFKTLMAGYGPSVWAYWPLFLITFGLFLLGVAAQYKRWTAGALLALLTFVPIIANAILWSHRHFSFYEDRLFIFSGAVGVMGVAAGLRALKKPWLTGLGLAAIAAFTMPCLNDYYAHRVHPVPSHNMGIWDKVDCRAAAAYLQSNLKEGDVVGLASHFTMYPFKHYLDWPKICRLGDSRHDETVFIKTQGNAPLLRSHGLMPVPKEEATRDARRVWFVETFGRTFDWQPTTDLIRHWLDEHWAATERHTFHGLHVTLYERKATQPSTSGPPS